MYEMILLLSVLDANITRFSLECERNYITPATCASITPGMTIEQLEGRLGPRSTCSLIFCIEHNSHPIPPDAIWIGKTGKICVALERDGRVTRAWFILDDALKAATPAS